MCWSDGRGLHMCCSYCGEDQLSEITSLLSSIVDILNNLDQTGKEMDKKIKSIQKDTKNLAKKESALLKDDKKRDKACDMGAKMMKKK